jgi:hypothetical protein
MEQFEKGDGIFSKNHDATEMRPVLDHNHYLVGMESERLTIRASDIGPGGAPNTYLIEGFDVYAKNLNCGSTRIWFQNGPIPEKGINGVTHEVLIAIVIDRLRSFQKGLYACRENALVITNLEQAMHWLHSRTRERAMRGVEGIMEK